MPRFNKLLVANRGEIACRVLRTARDMGYQTVAVFSEADRAAPFVALADEAVCIGAAPPAQSYLNVAAILEAARKTGADALHPGYGFLSENAEFARSCAEAGIVFVGPPADAIFAMGDKARAKQRMREAGVPTVPGFWGEASLEQLAVEAERVGYPLLVKATAGGGGRGIRVAENAAQLPQALHSARAEAQSAFGDGTLMLERFITRGRHVEIQVFADQHGNAVYLAERDCTAQRRRQKVIEEAPSPIVTPALREQMGRAAVTAALAVGYQGAGTVELIVDQKLDYYFLEMNTRLQVEHPVTELITGLDLVRLQLLVAEGQALPFAQDDVKLSGHAIEARLYAEDPYAGFAPQTGSILRFPVERALTQPAIRIDSGIEAGSQVTPYYDAMVAKVIAHGATRDEAARRLCRALLDCPLYGLRTNTAFLIDLLRSPEFVRGELYTSLLDEWVAEKHPLLQAKLPDDEAWLLAAAVVSGAGLTTLRSGSVSSFELSLSCQGVTQRLQISRDGQLLHAQLGSNNLSLTLLSVREHTLRYQYEGIQRSVDYLRHGAQVQLALHGHVFVFEEPSALQTERTLVDPRLVVAPLAGSLISVRVAVGDQVKQGDVLAVIEAMKMETRIMARIDATVSSIVHSAGEQVEAGEQLMQLRDTEPT